MAETRAAMDAEKTEKQERQGEPALSLDAVVVPRLSEILISAISESEGPPAENLARSQGTTGKSFREFITHPVTVRPGGSPDLSITYFSPVGRKSVARTIKLPVREKPESLRS